MVGQPRKHFDAAVVQHDVVLFAIHVSNVENVEVTDVMRAFLAKSN